MFEPNHVSMANPFESFFWSPSVAAPCLVSALLYALFLQVFFSWRDLLSTLLRILNNLCLLVVEALLLREMAGS